jgi:hypothetical protein
MSNAGNTHYEIGTRVRLRGITDPHDVDLNGREGFLCNPFKTFLANHVTIRDVGVRLDAVDGGEEESVMILRNEFEVLSEPKPVALPEAYSKTGERYEYPIFVSR